MCVCVCVCVMSVLQPVCSKRVGYDIVCGVYYASFTLSFDCDFWSGALPFGSGGHGSHFNTRGRERNGVLRMYEPFSCHWQETRVAHTRILYTHTHTHTLADMRKIYASIHTYIHCTYIHPYMHYPSIHALSIHPCIHTT